MVLPEELGDEREQDTSAEGAHKGAGLLATGFSSLQCLGPREETAGKTLGDD